MVKVKLFADFRTLFGKSETNVQAHSVQEAIEQLISEVPELERKLFNSSRTVEDEYVIFLNGKNVKQLSGFQTELNEGDIISLFPPVAGG